MTANKCCQATQQDLKRDYSDLRVGDFCPVCEIKIGFHINLLPQSSGSYLYCMNIIIIIIVIIIIAETSAIAIYELPPRVYMGVILILLQLYEFILIVFS